MKKFCSLGAKKARPWVFGVIALALGLAVAACSFGPVTAPQPPVPTNQTINREYLALLKTQANHKLSADELQAVVDDLLNKPSAGRSAALSGSRVTGVKKLALGEQRFASFGPGRSAAKLEEEPVEVYEFAVGDPGGADESFVLACNDTRVGPILAHAEGSMGEGPEGFNAVLQKGIEGYIAAIIFEYDSITGAEIDAAVEKALKGQVEGARGVGTGSSGGSPWDIVDQYGGHAYTDFCQIVSPLLMTKWDQGGRGPYTVGGQAYNNLVKFYYDIDNYAGCNPTAIAQIIAYHNYIVPHPSAPLPAAFSDPQLGIWSGSFNLSQIRTMESIYNNNSAEAKAQVAMLMYYIGHKEIGNAIYFPDDGLTSLGMSNARTAFERLGYTVTNYQDNNGNSPTTITGTPDNFTITYRTSPGIIKNALDNGRPILFAGYPQAGGGHAWVIDGYATMSFRAIIWKYVAPGTVLPDTPFLLLSGDHVMVHCNLGWNGNKNGWYVYGLFDTSNPVSRDRSVTAGARNFSMATMMFIPVKP
jgi:hypothetical protein